MLTGGPRFELQQRLSGSQDCSRNTPSRFDRSAVAPNGSKYEFWGSDAITRVICGPSQTHKTLNIPELPETDYKTYDDGLQFYHGFTGLYMLCLNVVSLIRNHV